jgi:hypothetical protein
MTSENFKILKILIQTIGETKMKMKRYAQLSLVPVLLSSPLPLLAGDLDSPAAPTDAGSAMYTIEDIYNRLNKLFICQ